METAYTQGYQYLPSHLQLETRRINPLTPSRKSKQVEFNQQRILRRIGTAAQHPWQGSSS